MRLLVADAASPMPLGVPRERLGSPLFGFVSVFAVERAFAVVFFTGIRAAIFDAASDAASSTTFRAKRASFVDNYAVFVRLGRRRLRTGGVAGRAGWLAGLDVSHGHHHVARLAQEAAGRAPASFWSF